MINGKIYVLIDPTNNQIRYVGQTICLIKTRFSQHISEAKKHTKTKKCAWIKGLINEGLLPLINVVYETSSKQELDNKEIELISKYDNLTNSTSGGEVTPNVGYLKRKRVYRSDGVEFEYVGLAAKEMKVTSSGIVGAIKKSGWCCKFKWSYLPFQEPFFTKIEKEKKVILKRKVKRSDGKIYDTIMEVVIDMKVGRASLMRALNKERKTLKKYSWNYTN